MRNKICQKNLIIFTTYSFSLYSLLSHAGGVDYQCIFSPPFHISIYSTNPRIQAVITPNHLFFGLLLFRRFLSTHISPNFTWSSCHYFFSQRVSKPWQYILFHFPLYVSSSKTFFNTFYELLILSHLVTPHTYTSAFSFLQISFFFLFSRINAQHSHPYILYGLNSFYRTFLLPIYNILSNI